MIIDKIIEDFIVVCKLAQINLTTNDIKKLVWPAGNDHKPVPLLNGHMAVYIFTSPTFDKCYKVGKVFVNSNARYQTQHYSHSSSKSNLAKALLDDYGLNSNFTPDNIGNWIKQNITRTNLLLDAAKGVRILNLLEAFIQLKLDPAYEGYKSEIKKTTTPQ